MRHIAKHEVIYLLIGKGFSLSFCCLNLQLQYAHRLFHFKRQNIFGLHKGRFGTVREKVQCAHCINKIATKKQSSQHDIFTLHRKITPNFFWSKCFLIYFLQQIWEKNLLTHTKHGIDIFDRFNKSKINLKGDSGGPLYIIDSSTGIDIQIVVGVLSAGGGDAW